MGQYDDLIKQAERIRTEINRYANDAERIGKMHVETIKCLPPFIDLSQLNSLNKPESCRRYMVEEKNTGVIIGVLDIVMPWSRSSVLQRFTTSVQLSSLNAGDAIPTMEYSNLYTYDRFFNNSSSVLEGVNKGEWSKWKEAYDLNNFAESVKWNGEIVNDVTISPNSYTGDDGTVVLVGNYTFAYKVISGGNTIYYGNWHGREDYQKNIYQSGTIGWKAGFYDYLLYVSPTSVWMKKSDSELVNITESSGGSGSGDVTLDKLPSNIMYEISGVTSTSGYSIKSNYKNPSTGGLTSSVLTIPTVASNRAGIMTTDMYQKMVANQAFQFEYQDFDTDFYVGTNYSSLLNNWVGFVADNIISSAFSVKLTNGTSGQVLICPGTFDFNSVDSERAGREFIMSWSDGVNFHTVVMSMTGSAKPYTFKVVEATSIPISGGTCSGIIIQ